jgi:hypothetical protein
MISISVALNWIVGHVLPKTMLKITEYTHPPDRKVMRAMEVTLT